MYAKIDGNKIKVYDAYTQREAIKAICGRAWNADEKVWELPLNKFSIRSLARVGCVVQDYYDPETHFVSDKPLVTPRINGKLYAHQVKAFNFALNTYLRSPGVAYLMDMGTGKTITSIAVVGTLYASDLIKRLLIVSPLSITAVWQNEFEKFAAYDYSLEILQGTGAKTEKALKSLRSDGLEIIVVNYESAWRLETEIGGWRPDMIICDESTKIKSPDTKCSKALHRLAKVAKYRMILTGTPITNNPLDIFSQYKFLDPDLFGSSFYSFRAHYAVMGGYQNHQVVRWVNLDELTEKAHSIAYRVRLADAVELPDTIDEVIPVSLDDRAIRTYKQLETEFFCALDEEYNATGTIKVRNVLTKMLRLSQVTGGFLKDSAGKDVCLHQAKLQALEDIIDSSGNDKIVVFVRFLSEIEAIEKLLKSKGIKYSLISGEVQERDEQVKSFQNDPEVKVFVGQLATTSMGLTLTAAHIAVFYSLDYNYANYSQSKARIHRIGQTQKCVYYHIIAKGTIDEQIMRALGNKADIASFIVDRYKTRRS